MCTVSDQGEDIHTTLQEGRGEKTLRFRLSAPRAKKQHLQDSTIEEYIFHRIKSML
jgi:hypothetical protein